LQVATKVSDWVITSALCSDEYFKSPLTEYEDEAGYWYADLDVIYIRYVSDHASYGGDLSLWPVSFIDYVGGYFAKNIILKLTSDEKKRDDVRKELKERLLAAQNSDAMAGPVRFRPHGAWSSSRRGSRGDRGSYTSLIG